MSFVLLTIIDGLINSYAFFIEYFSNKNITEVYKLPVYERFILYVIFNKVSFLIVLPQTQEFIITNFDIQYKWYLEFKKTTFLYIKSKICIHLINGLSNELFVSEMYLHLEDSMQIVYNIIIFLSFNILRNIPATYNCYRVFKLAYYNQTGYLYNVLGYNQSIELMNTMIKSKNWQMLQDFHIINAICCLIIYNISLIDLKIEIYKFNSILTVINALNYMFVLQMNVYLVTIYIMFNKTIEVVIWEIWNYITNYTIIIQYMDKQEWNLVDNDSFDTDLHPFKLN